MVSSACFGQAHRRHTCRVPPPGSANKEHRSIHCFEEKFIQSRLLSVNAWTSAGHHSRREGLRREASPQSRTALSIRSMGMFIFVSRSQGGRVVNGPRVHLGKMTHRTHIGHSRH